MSDTPDWPVPVVAARGAAVGSCVWQQGDKVYLTAIVKASFAIRSGGKVELIEPEPISRAENHIGGLPTRSLRTIREDVARLCSVDVLLNARAYPDERGNRGAVRFLMSRDGSTVIDKQATIYGNRASSDDDPKPFKSILLGYEKALGGIGFAANPAGTGAGVMTKTPPNIVDLEAPAEKSVAFGPIPQTWPSRKAHRGDLSTKALDRPVVTIPTGFDWAYFQSAPLDQRLDTLRGDETIELSGVQPMGATLRFSLPQAHAHVRIDGPSNSGAPPFMPLIADVLFINAAKRRFTIIWRDHVKLSTPQLASKLVVVGAIELPSEPVNWPPPSARTEVTASDVLDTEPLVDKRRGAPASASAPEGAGDGGSLGSTD